MSNSTEEKTGIFTRKKVLVAILGILLALIVFGGGYGFYLLSKTNKVDINKDNLEINTELDSKEITNIALYGVDAPQCENGFSNTIMILTIDEKHNKLKLSSIMKDTYVDVKDHGKTNLANAYAYGGLELAINTLNSNFDLNIDKFITVNFHSLPKIIDELGGVSVNITNGDLEHINRYIDGLNESNNTNSSHITQTGIQTIDGTQAAAYATIIYDGGDESRTSRQRDILESLFDKASNISISEIPGILDEFLPLVYTNMSSTDLISVGTDIIRMRNSTKEESLFPNDKNVQQEVVDGIEYQVIDKDAVTKDIHQFIFEEQK